MRTLAAIVLMLALACSSSHRRGAGEPDDAPNDAPADDAMESAGDDDAAGSTGGDDGSDAAGSAGSWEDMPVDTGGGGGGAPDDSAAGAGAGGSDPGREPPQITPELPADCASDQAFVLSIDPAGNSGRISGWLSSEAHMIFVDQLPYLSPELDDPQGGIALWWTTRRASEGRLGLRFYPVDHPSTVTELAVAEGATRFEEVDVSALEFTSEASGALEPGAIAVFRSARTAEAVALRLESIASVETAEDTEGLSGECSVIEATWSFAL